MHASAVLERELVPLPIDNSVLEGGTGVWLLDRAVVERVSQRVGQVLASLGEPVNTIPVPTTGELAHMVTAVFWASILPDEHRFLRPSLVYAPLYATQDQVTLKRPVTLTAEALAKLAPAQPQGSHFWVRKGPLEELQLFAVTQSPPAGIILRVEGPGQVVVQVLYWNVAALRRRTFIDLTRRLDDGRTVGVGIDELEIVLGGLAETAAAERGRRRVLGKVLSRILAGMRAHEHGGTIIVVPAADGDESWRASLDQSWIELADAPSLRGQLEKLAEMSSEWDVGQHMASDHEFLRIVRTIARLTAVDGATILDDHGRILGFGAKIRMPSTMPECALPMTQTLWGELARSRPREVVWGELGGTRHLSAALFVAQNPRAIALVCSMDGPTKILAWSTTLKPPRVAIVTDLELLLTPEVPH